MTTPDPSKVEEFELRPPGAESPFWISLSRPRERLPQASVPIIFITDGDLQFGMAAQLVRFGSSLGALSPCVVVGIGYGVPMSDFLRLRAADLTPPLSVEGQADIAGLGAYYGESWGGADSLVRFITEVLTSEVCKRCPEASSDRSVLFGHSLGGLFVAHTLLTRPTLFSAYLISSPSLWWDRFALLNELPPLGQRIRQHRMAPRALIMVGGREEDPPTTVPPGVALDLETCVALTARCRMVSASRDFAQALAGQGVSVDYQVFEREDHLSVIPAALTRGLWFAFSPAHTAG